VDIIQLMSCATIQSVGVFQLEQAFSKISIEYIIIGFVQLDAA